MANRRNARKAAVRTPAKASAAASRPVRKSPAQRNAPTQPELSDSSDEESIESEGHNDDDDDDEDNDDDDEEEEDEDDISEDAPSEPALSGFYPFEFDNDGSMTGTDDELDAAIPPVTGASSEFEKSMEMADIHATFGAEESDDAADYDGMVEIEDDEESEDEMIQDEEDDQNMLRAAERDLIAEFEESEFKQIAAPALPSSVIAPTTATDGDRAQRHVSFAGLDDDPFSTMHINLNDDPFQGARFMDDTWGSLWENAELGIWRKPGADGEMQDPVRNSKTKRVRFQDSAARTPHTNAAAAVATAAASSDDTSSDEDEDEAEQQFPDIFMDQADPKIQRLLANDSEAEWNGFNAHGSDGESVYDFEDDADRFAFEMDQDSESDDADESSDSEDDGDETEDETVEEQQARMQKFRKQVATAFTPTQPSTPQTEKAGMVSSVKSTSAARRLTTPRSSKGPRQGVFICDPTKATLTTDKSTRKTILYPPAKPTPQHKAFWDRAKTATHKSGDSPAGSIAIPARARDQSPDQPFTAKATLGSMFDGRIDLFESAPEVTPAPTLPPPMPEVVQPFPLYTADTMTSFSSVADEASDMDAEYPAAFSTMLNMDRFEDDSSDTDMATPAGINSHQPAFLAQGVVGSFRLNQHRAKIESSLASNPAKRASTAEYNALQSGRRGAGNAPITPARKRRSNSQDVFKTGSGIKKNSTPAYSSPLAARRRSRGQSLSGRLDQTLTPEMWKRA